MGFSLKSGAVSRYCLTTEYRAVYLGMLRNMACQGSSKLCHPDRQGPGPPTAPNAVGIATRRWVPAKTNKAALARELEKNVSPAEEIPTSLTCNIDGIFWYKG